MTAQVEIVQTDLIVMTPVVQGVSDKVIRVERFSAEEWLSSTNIPNDILHVAGGQHTGIIVRKQCPQDELKISQAQISLEFTVYLVDPESGVHKKEKRHLSLWYMKQVSSEQQHTVANQFFESLLQNNQKDYLGFIKRVIKLVQHKFPALKRVQLSMHHLDDVVEAPCPRDYIESGTEVEAVSGAHVQDVLEHAYPNSMSVQLLASTLRCEEGEIAMFLEELSERNLVRRLENGEWIRVEANSQTESSMVKHMPRMKTSEQPTVAIVCALFVEKLAVDAIIDDKKTFHRYKSDGESNVYTLGTICGRRVVSTKLSAIGHTRIAMTAAGSITTRLLGGFQDVEHVFVVGVGGGVPHISDPQRHVRLGDVVVSSEVHGAAGKNAAAYVYCDKIERNRESGVVQGYGLKTFKRRDQAITNAVKQCIDGENSGGELVDGFVNVLPWTVYATEAVNKLTDDQSTVGNDYDFSRPTCGDDELTLPMGDGNVMTVAHPDQRKHSKLHLGPIGAGLQILKDAHLRADFASKFGVKAYDVDSSCVVESIDGNRIDSWAIVRGICDYGDGLRNDNKHWQAHAALQAAAVTKMIISQLPPSRQ